MLTLTYQQRYIRRCLAASMAESGPEVTPASLWRAPWGDSGDDTGWCRDQLQGLDISSGSDVNEPKVRAHTITVRPAMTSNLSSQEHKPTPSPEMSMLIPAWLWETIQQQEKQESREKTREPATPQPCPEARTVTPSPAPTTCNTRDDSSPWATNHAGDLHDTCGTRLTCDTCSRRDSSHTRDTSVTRGTRDTRDTISTCDSCDTRSTSFTCDALSTQDTTGACNIDDTRGTCDTCNSRVTSDTCLTRDTRDTRDTRGTRDTDGTHGTCDTSNTNGTHDIGGKVPEGIHCLPDVPDVGSSTLVGQPENMSPVTPSGLTQKKKGVAGNIWRCLPKYLYCGLPSMRANNKVIQETANGWPAKLPETWSCSHPDDGIQIQHLHRLQKSLL